jgi:hypothetical protein
MYTSIKPGKPWLDTKGKRIQAHGFSVFYNKADKLYYWYGENKEYTKPFGTVWHWGVRCYTSKDLYNWEDRGLIIPPEPDDLSSPLHPTYCMDRPHIIYCEKTGKYVAWLKIMGGATSQFMSVLQADKFFGPYRFVHKMYKPLKMDTGDFDLYADGETGKGCFIFDRPHFEVVTATLTEDYTGVTGEYSAHYQKLRIPYTREAPTHFTRNGRHYLFTSGTTGYWPNPSQTAVFEDFHGVYRDLGDPHIGDKTGTSFSSQIACVLKIPDRDLYIACADRWKPGAFNTWMAGQYRKMVVNAMKEGGRAYNMMKPDYSEKEAATLPERKRRHFDNTRISDYVWLPIEWQGEKPVIRWRDEWRIEDL